VRMLPAPSQPIPIWVGGTSDRALRRAARNDGWIGVLQTGLADTTQNVRRVREYRAREGRQAEPFMVGVSGWTNDLDVIRTLEDAGVDTFFVSVGQWAKDPSARRRDAIREYAQRIQSR